MEAAGDGREEEIDRNGVLATAGDDEVGVALAGFDKLLVHRLHGGEVLIEDLIKGPPADRHVAADPTNESRIGVRIDEDLDVEMVADAFIDEEQDAIDDDHIRGCDPLGGRATAMAHEIVHWFVDRHAGRERAKMRLEQVEVERIGMVPVELPQFVMRLPFMIRVIRVHVDERALRVGQTFCHASGHGGLAGPRASGNPDDQRAHTQESRGNDTVGICPGREKARSDEAVTVLYRALEMGNVVGGRGRASTASAPPHPVLCATIHPASGPWGAVFFWMFRPAHSAPVVALATALTFGAPGAAAAQERIAITIAATTDVHGRLRGWDYVTGRPDSLRGLTRAATIIDSVRAANRGRVVLVDAGDLLQGNAMTYVAGRIDSLAPHPVVTAMNAMRYDAAAVGNHEFNYGLPLFDRAARQARFPFLAANTRRLDGGPPYPGRTMVTRAGVKIAIIGATTPGSMIWDRDNLRGRLEVTDIVAALPPQVAAARAEGADIVVVVAHAGLTELSSYDTTASGLGSENPMARVAREVEGIDAIVIGHSHREVTDTTINGVLVVQPRNWATSVALATLDLERRGGKWVVVAKRGETVQVRGQPERGDLVRAVARAHRAAVTYSTSVVGRTSTAWPGDSVRLRDTPLIDLIQAVQLQESGAELSIASSLNLGAAFEAGPITVERLVALYPYENTLRAVRLSGAQVRAFLEHTARYWLVKQNADGSFRVESDPNIPGYNYDMLQGLDYTIELSRPMGRRITTLTRNGRPVADTDSFTVAINNYRAGGGGGYDMLRGAPVVYEGTRELRELIVDEIRRRGTIEPSDVYVENWRMLPPRRTLRVIGINDVHGAFTARPDGASGLRGGLAELAGYVRDAREECAPVCVTIHLNGGDLFTGTPASDLAFGRTVVPIINAMGTDAIALGNHEFDYGQDTLRARLRELRAPVLGVNVTDSTGKDAAWVPDDTIITLAGGVKIGVIGIADPATPRTTRAIYVADLRFQAPAALIRQRAVALRARGARRVLLVAHLGGFCERNDPDNCRGEIFDLARAVGPGTLDAIVSGHTHSEVRTIVNGTPIVQARSSARAIGVIDLPLDGPITSPLRPEVREVIPGRVRPDSTVAALVAVAEAAVAGRIAATIATTDDRWPRSGPQYALGNLIADAQRAAGRGDVAVMNNGGIRAELRAGEITWGSLFEIQPFDNRLVVLEARGAALRKYFEGLVGGTTVNFHISGAVVEYDRTAVAGRRVTRVRMSDGRPLDDGRLYRIVMSDFMAGGGDGAALADSPNIQELNVQVLDALIAYLQRAPDGKVVMTDALQAPRFKAVP